MTDRLLPSAHYLSMYRDALARGVAPEDDADLLDEVDRTQLAGTHLDPRTLGTSLDIVTLVFSDGFALECAAEDAKELASLITRSNGWPQHTRVEGPSTNFILVDPAAALPIRQLWDPAED